MVAEDRHKGCGQLRDKDADCDRRPWHGLLYLTDIRTGREILVSSAVLLEVRNMTGVLVSHGDIITQQILNQDHFKAMVS